jgi:hypothetical protein
VFPGQPLYFTTPYCPIGYGWCPDCSACLAGGGLCGSPCIGSTTARTYDYNCDGASTRQPSGTNSCNNMGTCLAFPGCDASHLYYAGTPACGTAATQWNCGCSGPTSCLTGPGVPSFVGCR